MPKQKTKVNQPEKPKFRYVCDACTGVAGYSNIPEAVAQITCEVCGKVQPAKKENWIKI